ncbi:MAG: HepT-like ribonuclease domain-containing protein [Acetobacteraceae bacterium]
MTEKPASAKYLWDARRAAERVRRFTKGRSIDDHLRDQMLRSAVERQFEIIGEAFGAVLRSDGYRVVNTSVKLNLIVPNHRHDFDAKVWVLGGDITITRNSNPTTFRTGQCSEVPEVGELRFWWGERSDAAGGRGWCRSAC